MNSSVVPEFKNKLPLKVWISSSVLPNCVEPLVYCIEALTNSVWNSCAVTLPPTTKSFTIPTPPSIIKAPVEVEVELVVSVTFVIPVNLPVPATSSWYEGESSFIPT